VNRARIKICGVTRPEDADLAVELGADFIGLNFYPQSPRYLGSERACEIAAAVAGRARLVGVFVNAPAPTVASVAAEVGLDLLQFHGDERPADLSPFADRAIKALRLDRPPAPEDLEPWQGIWGFLVEGRHAALYGGTGESWAYEMIRSLPRAQPLFVAGGLTPETVAGAVRRSGAWGVDVSSGVESAPGIKDEVLMRRFCDEVKRGSK